MTKKFVVLFVILNFFLACFYLDTWQNGNSTSRAIAVVAFAESRTLQIDKRHEESVDKSFINGHYYSDKAPLPVFLVIPFYELVNLFGIQPEQMEKAAYIIGDILCGSIPFTAIILISFLFIRKETDSKISPVLLSTLPFYASFIFIYSGTFYGHLLSAFFLLAGYVSLRFQKRFFTAGILCGLSFATEFPTAIVFSVWALQIFYNEKSFKPVFRFLSGVIPSILFLAIYNYCITGSIFNFSYKYHGIAEQRVNYGFSFPKVEALWGLTFGLKRGIYIYAPFLVCLLYYILKKISSISLKEMALRFFSHYLFPVSVLSVLAISSFFEWMGGWCYGPRLIMFVAVLLFFEGIRIFSKTDFYKPLFGITIGFGIICAFLAKSTILYSIPEEFENPIKEQVYENFKNGNFNPNNLLTALLNVPPQTSTYIWLFSFVMILTSLTFWYKKQNAKQISQ